MVPLILGKLHGRPGPSKRPPGFALPGVAGACLTQKCNTNSNNSSSTNNSNNSKFRGTRDLSPRSEAPLVSDSSFASIWLGWVNRASSLHGAFLECEACEDLRDTQGRE